MCPADTWHMFIAAVSRGGSVAFQDVGLGLGAASKSPTSTLTRSSRQFDRLNLASVSSGYSSAQAEAAAEGQFLEGALERGGGGGQVDCVCCGSSWARRGARLTGWAEQPLASAGIGGKVTAPQKE